MADPSAYLDESVGIFTPLTEEPNRTVSQSGVHLYHFPISLCSQKVRFALEEKGVSWTSDIIKINKFQQFNSVYAAINPRCVVPTLVEHGKVTTDAENILRHLDDIFPDTRVINLKNARVAELLHEIDTFPIKALTYADSIPGDDHHLCQRPVMFRNLSRMEDVVKVITLLEQLSDKYKDDAVLSAVYTAALTRKRRFYESMNDAAGLRRLLEVTHTKLIFFEEILKNGPFHSGGWMLDWTVFTSVDICLAVVLHRLYWLRLQPFVGDQREVPHVWAFYKRASSRPAFKKAVLGWSVDTIPP